MRISAPSLRGARPRHVSKVRALVLHGSHPAKQITVPNNDGAEVQGLMETRGVMQRVASRPRPCLLVDSQDWAQVQVQWFQGRKESRVWRRVHHTRRRSVQEFQIIILLH